MEFDHEWFGLDRLEAAGLTPRQRANLEVAVEALDDSGLGCLAMGSNAAVVFGAIGGTNTAHQLSRALDLRGPSLTVDSQRASPLVAVDMGVRLLADESVPFVLAGGVDLALLPDISDLRLPALPTGPPAAGVCTVLVLQRTRDAERTRTRRHAEIGGPGIGFPDAVGANAHISLDDTARDGTRGPGRGDEPPILIPVSGRDAAAVHDLALRWAVAAGSYASLRDFAAATARLIPERTRAAVLARDLPDATAQLRLLARRLAAVTPPHLRTPTMLATPPIAATEIHEVFEPHPARRPGGLLFLFSGTGTHPRMGRALAARYPVFAATLTAATDAVVAAGGPRVWTPRHGFDPTHAAVGIRSRVVTTAPPGHAPDPSTDDAEITAAADSSELTGNDSSVVRALEDNPVAGRTAGSASDAGEPDNDSAEAFTQAALFVFQVALAELLESWGIRADAMTGHGIGELAAAVAGGALTVADAARVVVARGRVAGRAMSAGAVAVFEATPTEVRRLVEPMRAEVDIVSVDGPTTITVAGEPRYIDVLVRRAHRRAISAQRLPGVSGAAHHPVMQSTARQLAADLTDIEPRPPWCTIYSTSARGVAIRSADELSAGEVAMDGRYWAANASNPIELASALETAAAEGISTVLELGPGAVLTAAVRKQVQLRDGAHSALTGTDEAGSFLRAVARLYREGRAVDWTALGPYRAAPPQRQWRRGTPGGDGWRAEYSQWPTSRAVEGTAAFPAVDIRADGAYVVTGGLGAAGEAAVRWLLDGGATDVVVLTRTPRPLPLSLSGLEDRIVLIRCDCSDPADLAVALEDIRECGSAIRGIVDTADEPPFATAPELLELTTADPTDFTVLFTPGPAADSAMRELAAAQPDRRVICVEWDVGPAA
ncbi:acyltransferase domain-containing protein [Nocardia sp. NBC_00511]|uniref:acyltransferase domain-containing protein n=1 Tax=Nocardia sp. NBC_00511 TaxID=2903591 RepID=UPI00386D19E8